jgi:hypothetical protein
MLRILSICRGFALAIPCKQGGGRAFRRIVAAQALSRNYLHGILHGKIAAKQPES